MRIALLAPALLLLGQLATGCTGTQTTAALEPAEKLVTGSVTQANEANGIDPRTAEIIKTRVSTATAFTAPLEWKNEETGASGAITGIESYRGRHGQACRSFRTSIANFLGVSLFDGETCAVSKRSWILSWLKRFD